MNYKHYVTRYGEGNFEVIWVEDPLNHPELMAAYRQNQSLAQHAKEKIE